MKLMRFSENLWCKKVSIWKLEVRAWEVKKLEMINGKREMKYEEIWEEGKN